MAKIICYKKPKKFKEPTTFLSLPIELRLMIYKYFLGSTVATLRQRTDLEVANWYSGSGKSMWPHLCNPCFCKRLLGKGKWRKKSLTPYLSLLLAHSTCYFEATPLVDNEVTFQVVGCKFATSRSRLSEINAFPRYKHLSLPQTEWVNNGGAKYLSYFVGMVKRTLGPDYRFHTLETTRELSISSLHSGTYRRFGLQNSLTQSIARASTATLRELSTIARELSFELFYKTFGVIIKRAENGLITIRSKYDGYPQLVVILAKLFLVRSRFAIDEEIDSREAEALLAGASEASKWADPIIRWLPQTL